jgi:hypothetical protein
MPETQEETRRCGFRSVAEVSLIPTQLLVAITLFYFIGGWLGGQQTPDKSEDWAGYGVLVGLATGIYLGYKTLKKFLQKSSTSK